MIYQLTRGATPEQWKNSKLAAHYANHGDSLYPHDAAGVPFTVAYIQAKGDPITDLHEDMAAEQKARATYEHLIAMSDDPGVIDTLRFLREREVVHFQRFGETLRKVIEFQERKRYY